MLSTYQRILLSGKK